MTQRAEQIAQDLLKVYAGAVINDGEVLVLSAVRGRTKAIRDMETTGLISSDTVNQALRDIADGLELAMTQIDAIRDEKNPVANDYRQAA